MEIKKMPSQRADAEVDVGWAWRGTASAVGWLKPRQSITSETGPVGLGFEHLSSLNIVSATVDQKGDPAEW
jgi:hypothetical protein